MGHNKAIVPHFSYPFRLGRDGSFSVVEQDSVDDVAQCIQVLLGTTKGSRLEVPEYGVPDPTFVVELDEAMIRAEIERWEPRAAVVLTDTHDQHDELLRTLAVRVTTRREG